jgi:hypothetical protein
MAFMNPRDVVTYVSSDLLYGNPPTEDGVRDILAILDLQQMLILCARLNAVIAGIGTVAMEDRIHHALQFLELPREERRIRKFLGPVAGYATLRLFFRGQRYRPVSSPSGMF